MDKEGDKGRTVLLTGFGPFPGVRMNASAELVRVLSAQAARRYPDFNFGFEILPVEWEDGPAYSLGHIEAYEPELILHFGVCEHAMGFVIETQARNFCTAAADARGELPASDLLAAEAAPYLETTIPHAAAVDRLRQIGLPASLSQDAGGYLCNAVLFQTLRSARSGVQAGFVHVPSALMTDDRSLRGTCPLTMDEAVRGGLEIVAACLED